MTLPMLHMFNHQEHGVEHTIMNHTIYDLTLLSLSYMFPNYGNINGKEGKIFDTGN